MSDAKAFPNVYRWYVGGCISRDRETVERAAERRAATLREYLPAWTEYAARGFWDGKAEDCFVIEYLDLDGILDGNIARAIAHSLKLSQNQGTVLLTLGDFAAAAVLV